MSERQYSDDEVAAIFADSSEVERTALPIPSEGKGLTIAAGKRQDSLALCRAIAGWR